MHVQSGCSGNDSDIVIPSLPCSDSQPADLLRFLMDGLGTEHRVWFQRFGTTPAQAGMPINSALLKVRILIDNN